MRTALNGWIRRLAGDLGVDLIRKPPFLLKHPEHELRMGVEFALAHHAASRPDLTFIQVGAYDGRAHDPLNNALRDRPCRGVLLEPQPDVFRRLRETYEGRPGLILINAAISDRDGSRTLYRVRPDAVVPDWARELASFDRSHVEKHQSLVPNLGAAIEGVDVPCLTFETLFAEHGIGDVDLLQVDTEGYDFEILKLYDVPRRKPSIINFEHKHLSKRDWDACVTMLAGLGYRMAVGQWDTLAYLEPS